MTYRAKPSTPFLNRANPFARLCYAIWPFANSTADLARRISPTASTATWTSTPYGRGLQCGATDSVNFGQVFDTRGVPETFAVIVHRCQVVTGGAYILGNNSSGDASNGSLKTSFDASPKLRWIYRTAVLIDPSPLDTQWHVWIGGYWGGIARLYKDGQLIASAATSPAAVNPAPTIAINAGIGDTGGMASQTAFMAVGFASLSDQMIRDISADPFAPVRPRRLSPAILAAATRSARVIPPNLLNMRAA